MDRRGGYLAALRRSWLLLLVVAIVSAAAGAVWFLLTPAAFTSTLDLYVSTPKGAGTDPQAADQFARSRVNSYVQLLGSEELASRIVRSNGVDLTPAQVAHEITASGQPDTVIIHVAVRDASARRSLLIARGIANNFGKLVDDMDNPGRAAAVVVIRVVSQPAFQAQIISPNPILYVGAGLAIGLVAGLLAVAMRRLADHAIWTARTAQRVVGVPLIGKIPYVRKARTSPLIIDEEPSSGRFESFLQLRLNLQHLETTKSAKVLMITASQPDEGTTTTAVNLALAFVEAGERVMLIDANLRRPEVADLLELPSEPGLSNVISGQATAFRAVRRWGGSGLGLLASGSVPPTPAKWLGSTQMDELVDLLRHNSDKIIIDTPPTLAAADALIISSFADAVILVIRHGKTGQLPAAAAAKALRAVDAPLVGSVFTMRRVGRRQRRRYGELPWIANRNSNASSKSKSRPAKKTAETPRVTPADVSSGSAVNGRGRSNVKVSESSEETSVVETIRIPNSAPVNKLVSDPADTGTDSADAV